MTNKQKQEIAFLWSRLKDRKLQHNTGAWSLSFIYNVYEMMLCNDRLSDRQSEALENMYEEEFASAGGRSHAASCSCALCAFAKGNARLTIKIEGAHAVGCSCVDCEINDYPGKVNARGMTVKSPHSDMSERLDKLERLILLGLAL